MVITWPVVLSPTELLVGHPGNDIWNHIWGYWWVSDAISEGNWPTNAALLAYPNGGTLYFIDTIQVIFSASRGLWVLSLLQHCGDCSACAGGFASWLLSRQLTELNRSWHVLGHLWCSTSHHRAVQRISETVCAGWVPLTLWALLRNMENPSARNSLLLASARVCIDQLLLWTLAALQAP